MRHVALACAALSAALLTAGCNGAPGDSIGSLRLGIVTDRAVHTYTDAFRIWVALADLDGQRVTCDQIPNTYQFENFLKNAAGTSNLACVNNADCAVQLPWNGSFEEGSQQLRVLTGKPVIIVVEALAERQGTGTFFIGRGCQSNTVGFVDGTSPTVEIDVTASVGSRCTTGTCEVNLTCQSGPGFQSGYCTRSCSSNQDCPPGSHCVSGAASGSFCARQCLSLQDCNAVDGQVCQGGSGADGCAEVCVPQTSPKC